MSTFPGRVHTPPFMHQPHIRAEVRCQTPYARLITLSMPRDGNGERVVMFLCTRCRRINKYRARLPRYRCARVMIVHVVTFEFRLHTDNRTRRHIPDKHMGTWSIKQISPSRVLAGMSRKTHLISLSA